MLISAALLTDGLDRSFGVALALVVTAMGALALWLGTGGQILARGMAVRRDWVQL